MPDPCPPVLVSGSDLEVSSLCCGTMTFGDGADEQACRDIYALLRDHGVTFFDCANVYAEGESERILGRLIREHRDEVVITTKAGYPVGSGPDDQGLGPAHLSRQIDASLERLGTEYVDLYYFHRFDPDTPLQESLGIAGEWVAAGKVRHLGVSNFAAWQVMKARSVSAATGGAPVSCIQPMYNPLKRQCEAELLPMAASERMGVFTYGPLAGGLLTGKYGAGAEGARRLDESEMYQRRYARDHQAAEDFVALAREHGVHPATLAVAWARSHPAVTAPIIGARRADQLPPVLAGASFELTEELRAAIDGISPPAPIATDRSEEAGGA